MFKILKHSLSGTLKLEIFCRKVKEKPGICRFILNITTNATDGVKQQNSYINTCISKVHKGM